MAQHAESDGMNVFVREIVPAVEQGAGAGAAQQAQRRAWAGAERDVRMAAAGVGQVYDVVQQRLVAVHLRKLALNLQDQLGRE